jgi:hypothetical protein
MVKQTKGFAVSYPRILAELTEETFKEWMDIHGLHSLRMDWLEEFRLTSWILGRDILPQDRILNVSYECHDCKRSYYGWVMSKLIRQAHTRELERKESHDHKVSQPDSTLGVPGGFRV